MERDVRHVAATPVFLRPNRFLYKEVASRSASVIVECRLSRSQMAK